MADSFHKVRGALSLLSRGYAGAFLHEMGRQLASVERSYAFRRDLSVSLPPPPGADAVSLRPFERGDMALLALDNMRHKPAKAVIDRVSRIALIASGIPSCFTAVMADGSPCFIQWLITPGANERLRAYYKGYFPPLARDEVLLEGAFVPEAYRGRGIMARAMWQVAERGRAMGARWAVTWVEESNVPSIRGCLACGFHPYMRKTAVRRAFRRRVSYAPLSGEERAGLGS